MQIDIRPYLYAAIGMVALFGALFSVPRMVEHSVKQAKWTQEVTAYVASR